PALLCACEPDEDPEAPQRQVAAWKGLGVGARTATGVRTRHPPAPITDQQVALGVAHVLSQAPHAEVEEAYPSRPKRLREQRKSAGRMRRRRIWERNGSRCHITIDAIKLHMQSR